MAEAINGAGSTLIDIYTLLVSPFPPSLQTLFNLILVVLFVFLYSMFIWKFHRFVSNKNILELELNQYNKLEHPFLAKLLAGFFYFAEYLLILPLIVFVWFSIFAIFLVLFTENLSIEAILVVSATIVAVIRMASYYKKELAEELAKLLPLNLLAISLLNPLFFSVERILGNFREILSFFSDITIYIVFVVILEFILRFFNYWLAFFGVNTDEEIEEVTRKNRKRN
ncbi:MAG: hypothetical protein AABX28_01235 [Nanoarchaeota archaeon]